MTRHRSQAPAAAALALATLALAGLTAATPVAAQEEGAAGAPLVVGTKEAPPFAMKRADGSWHGLSIDLWQVIAAELGYSYELRELGLEELLSEVEAGGLDLGVAALTVTPGREQVLDFCHPFFTSGLGIAVTAERAGLLSSILAFLSWDFLKAVGALVLLLFAVGVVVWLFERRRNPEHFGGPPLRGLGSSFWFSAVTMTTVGYGDKAPVSAGGRVVALVWMFASLIAISGFTAAIASALTVRQLGSSVRGPEDLPKVQVATLPGSTSAAYLAARDVRFRELGSLDAALDALAAGEVAAVVYDAPILSYLVKERGDERLAVLGETFQRQDYAFALPEDSPLREPINRSLLRLLQDERWHEIRRRHLGK